MTTAMLTFILDDTRTVAGVNSMLPLLHVRVIRSLEFLLRVSPAKVYRQASKSCQRCYQGP